MKNSVNIYMEQFIHYFPYYTLIEQIDVHFIYKIIISKTNKLKVLILSCKLKGSYNVLAHTYTTFIL